jgi:protein subunit release factor B
MSERIIIGCNAVHPDRRGGQHVAMKCTGVLIIDDEQGIGVQCSSERSQHGNVTKARAMLAKLSKSAVTLSEEEREYLHIARNIIANRIRALEIDAPVPKHERALAVLDRLLGGKP